MTRHPALRRRRDDALIAVVLAASAALLVLGGWTWRADRLLYDTALAWMPRAAPAGIVIVAIDDASIEALGRWPWPRTVHATALERLADLQPRAVALDLVLSEPATDPAEDVWLARALARLGSVVMPVTWQAVAGQALVPLLPTAALRTHGVLGAAEPAVDADGVLRHVFLRAGPPQAPYPNAALALLHAGGESLHPALRPEAAPDAAGRQGWQRDDRLLLRYAGPPGSVRRLSYLDLLQGRVPPQSLAGQYVLIGMTAQGLGDTLATPVNAGHAAMPGVEVLAQTLHMLRSGDGLRPVPAPAVAGASALALLLLVIGFRRLGARRALSVALLSVPAAALAAVASLAAGWVWSPVPYAAMAVLAYPLWSWRRLEHVVAVLDREIQTLAAERLEAGPQAVVVHAAGVDRVTARLQDLAQAGQLLREARRFLAGTLDALPTAVLVGDAHHRVALANHRAAAVFDLADPADLLGLDLLRLVAEFQPRQAVDWAQALPALRPGATGLSVEAALGDGHHLVHAAAIVLLGQRRLIVSVADLGSVREAQRQREQTLAFVSHDLRAPANAILMLTDLHQQGRMPGQEQALLPEIRRLAARTLALSEDFVQAARAQTRPLSLAPVALVDLVEDGLADLQALAAAAGVQLQAEAVDSGSVVVDRGLVARALTNLVSNAIKHSPPGSQVCVRVQRRDAEVTFSVEDAGPGLAADQAAALVRGDDGVRAEGPAAVGLGLVFVQRVAQRHGGRLTQGPGPHSTLALTLPVPPGPDSGNP